MVRGGTVTDVHGYLIAATPRTGSSLLCEGLRLTGLAGHPDEYFTEEKMAMWRTVHNFARHEDYFRTFVELSRTPNGVIGIKLMYCQIIAWQKDTRRYTGQTVTLPQLLTNSLGDVRVIRLTRYDRLRQAISWVRACKTRVWSSGEHPVGAEPTYSPGLLLEGMHELDEEEHRWDALLRELGAPVMHMEYEAIAEDWHAAVNRALAFLEISHTLDKFRQRMRHRQADDLTEEWVTRARRDLFNAS